MFLLDGASFHMSQETAAVLKRLDIEAVISAPHSFAQAPVELAFSFLKRGNINPDKRLVSAKVSKISSTINFRSISKIF